MTMKRRSALTSAGALAIAATGLVACAEKSGSAVAPTSAPAAPPALTGGIPLLRLAWSDSGYLTPFRVSTTGPGGVNLLSLLYDTLTWKDAKGIVPWLASGWNVSGDGLDYTFTLRSGLTWHDERPLTADDVAFSFGYYARTPFRWMASDVVESAQATGTQTVRVRLKRPYAAFLEDIAGIVPILSRHIWEPVDDPLKFGAPESTIGSGPYRLTDYRAAEGAYQFIANDAYRLGRPRIRSFQSLNIPAETRIAALQNDQVDLTMSTDYSVLDLFRNDERVRVFETQPLSLARLALNVERAPLDRKDVRQALMYALDRQQIANLATKGPAITAGTGIVPPDTPWFNPTLKPYAHDPARAKQLLDQAGFPAKAGGRFILELLADPMAREVELMTPMLEAIGVTLNVKRVDAKTRTQLQRELNYQMAFTTHIGIGGDPDYLRRWYAGEEANDFAQGSVLHNAEYDRLGTEQAATLDPAKRRALVFRMQEIISDELPTIVLYHRRFLWLYRADRFAPMHTWGGLMNGIPFPTNKLAFLGAPVSAGSQKPPA